MHMFLRTKHLSAFFPVAISVIALTASAPASVSNGGKSTPKRVAVQDARSNEQRVAFQRYAELMKSAPAALSVGELDKARDYARQLLEVRAKIEPIAGFGPGLYADATHVGNLVLGRIALMTGDVAKAKEYLLAAGRVTAESAQLSSFGPNMLLAKELIERGERQTVIAYFSLCSDFWKLDNGRLTSWTRVVTDGGVPDFGPNIKYYFAD